MYNVNGDALLSSKPKCSKYEKTCTNMRRQIMYSMLSSKSWTEPKHSEIWKKLRDFWKTKVTHLSGRALKHTFVMSVSNLLSLQSLPRVSSILFLRFCDKLTWNVHLSPSTFPEKSFWTRSYTTQSGPSPEDVLCEFIASSIIGKTNLSMAARFPPCTQASTAATALSTPLYTLSVMLLSSVLISTRESLTGTEWFVLLNLLFVLLSWF